MSELFMGSDPEFFLVDRHGKLKSAIEVVSGTKENKIDLGNENKLFYDNVLAEVNIKPGNSADSFINNIQLCLKKLSKAVYPYKLLLQASATFPEEECKHPDALRFGCEPEYDAYSMSVVQAPECTTTFRSAGGHIHLGYSKEKWPLMTPTEKDGGLNRAWGRVWIVRMMDLFMGIPSLWIDQDPHSPARRKLYGKAGTHRPKEEYGVEYRATSNFWLRSPSTVRLAYSICEFVVNFVGQNKHRELWKINEEDHSEDTCTYNVDALCEAINNSDKKKASKFLNEIVKKYIPTNLYNQILAASESTKISFHREWGI